ncbi:hypothetical protein HX057_04495 [Myroides odoratimimus]|nr:MULTISPECIES: hypothetical protein [Myroides]MCA4793208.1 hypothetical protein [Myroides odoratimimus]MCA4820390.1 hypothetical protein [Myroides odoratimimus]MDM1064924.1 hypothetical protein [Myroides odoratimimus]MDM1085501.1 hypothetical protein [Myroides odoratimimus]MDM1413142.1 hypothetical protein [Myroides odoratimimus]
MNANFRTYNPVLNTTILSGATSRVSNVTTSTVTTITLTSSSSSSISTL